jgi:hypothetical protein
VHSLYKYDEHSDDTGSEIVDDNDEELEEQKEHPDEEQASVQKQDVAEDTETEDDDRKPSATKEAPGIMTQSTLERAQLTDTASVSLAMDQGCMGKGDDCNTR